MILFKKQIKKSLNNDLFKLKVNFKVILIFKNINLNNKVIKIIKKNIMIKLKIL